MLNVVLTYLKWEIVPITLCKSVLIDHFCYFKAFKLMLNKMPFTMGVGNNVPYCGVVCMTYLEIARFHIEIKHIFSLIGVLINLHQYKLQTNNFKKPNVFTNIGVMILSWVIRVTPKV